MRIITQDVLNLTRGHFGGRHQRRRIARVVYHTENGPDVLGADGHYQGVDQWDPNISRAAKPLVTESVDGDGTYWDSTGAIVGATANTGRCGGFSYATRNFGAVLESQRTNLVYPSAALDDWTPVYCAVTANQSAAPDGNTTGDLLREFSIDASGYVAKETAALIDNLAYALSVWVKKGTHTTFKLVLRDASVSANRLSVVFGWSDGVLGVALEQVGTGYVEAGTGGWYRAVGIVPANTIIGANTHSARLYVTVLPGELCTGTYWGAQLEAGAYATTYIPTTSAAVQRNADGWEADVADMSTGAHTIYASVVPNWNGASESNDHYIFDSRTGTNPGCCIYHKGSSNVLVAETLPASGNAGTGTSTTAVVRGSAYVVALAFDTNDLIFRVHDVGAGTDDDATDSTVTLPSSHQAIAIGRDKADANQWDGVIRDVLVYQWRHSAAQLSRNIAWLAARAS